MPLKQDRGVHLVRVIVSGTLVVVFQMLDVVCMVTKKVAVVIVDVAG